MLLIDREIRMMAQEFGLITPYDESLLNPASYDVTMGNHIKLETSEGIHNVDLFPYTQWSPYYVEPNQLIWVYTSQFFNLPANIACELKLKSSMVRPGFGWSRSGAEWGDPGWKNSNFTVFLKNSTSHTRLPVYPGMKIGQVVFFKTELVENPYDGKYNHTVGVAPAVV